MCGRCDELDREDNFRFEVDELTKENARLKTALAYNRKYTTKLKPKICNCGENWLWHKTHHSLDVYEEVGARRKKVSNFLS